MSYPPHPHLGHPVHHINTHRYWDEQRDAGHFSTSDIFSPRDGFGGDGHGMDNCIKDGPFAGYVLTIGPGYSNTEHCITRSINDDVSAAAGSRSIEECLRQPNFANAWPCIETNPHTAGHRGVGAGMVCPRAVFRVLHTKHA